MSDTSCTEPQSTPSCRGRYPALSTFLGIDHLVIGVADPDDAAAQLEADLGLSLRQPTDDAGRRLTLHTGQAGGRPAAIASDTWPSSAALEAHETRSDATHVRRRGPRRGRRAGQLVLNATSSSAFVGHGGAKGGQPIRSYVILVPAEHPSVVGGPHIAIGVMGVMGAWSGGA
jgi:hypothetical protein